MRDRSLTVTTTRAGRDGASSERKARAGPWCRQHGHASRSAGLSRSVAPGACQRADAEPPRAADADLVLAGERLRAQRIPRAVDAALERHPFQSTGRVVETTNGDRASVGDVPDDAAWRR
jgi:hypothetical protein